MSVSSLRKNSPRVGCLAVFVAGLLFMIGAASLKDAPVATVILWPLAAGVIWLSTIWQSVKADLRSERTGSSSLPAEDSVNRRQSATGYAPIYRSEFLSPEEEAEFVTVDTDGFPNIRLVHERGQLVMGVPQGIVNFRSRTLHKIGIFTLRARGTGYYEEAVTKSNLSPGSRVALLREPDNEYDENAIAIVGDAGVIGYVNRQNAKRLASRLDAGEEFSAITMSGSARGQDDSAVNVLIASPEMVAHLLRNV